MLDGDPPDVHYERFNYDRNPQSVTFEANAAGLASPDVTNLTTGQQVDAYQDYYEESYLYQKASVTFGSVMLPTGNYEIGIYSQPDGSNFVDDGILLDNFHFAFLRGDLNLDGYVNSVD